MSLVVCFPLQVSLSFFSLKKMHRRVHYWVRLYHQCCRNVPPCSNPGWTSYYRKLGQENSLSQVDSIWRHALLSLPFEMLWQRLKSALYMPHPLPFRASS